MQGMAETDSGKHFFSVKSACSAVNDQVVILILFQKVMPGSVINSQVFAFCQSAQHPGNFDGADIFFNRVMRTCFRNQNF